MSTNCNIKLSSDELMPILRCAPKTPGPLLVIVPSIFGITPDVIEYAGCFQQSGALVYALDSFWRIHPGPLSIPSEAPAALKRMNEVDPETVLSDLLSAIEHGQKEDLCNGSVVLLGICFGGQYVVQAAEKTSVRGLGSWHGGHLLRAINPSMLKDVHIQMDFGAEDPLIPMSDVQKIRALLEHRPNVHIRTHPNSGHGFTHTNAPPHNANAAEQAKRGVLNLISTFGGSIR